LKFVWTLHCGSYCEEVEGETTKIERAKRRKRSEIEDASCYGGH